MGGHGGHHVRGPAGSRDVRHRVRVDECTAVLRSNNL